MRDPRHNKGVAFTEKERNAHYLTGLLPPAVFSQELQVSGDQWSFVYFSFSKESASVNTCLSGKTVDENSARIWSATAEIHGHDGSPGEISLDKEQSHIFHFHNIILDHPFMWFVFNIKIQMHLDCIKLYLIVSMYAYFLHPKLTRREMKSCSTSFS